MHCKEFNQSMSDYKHAAMTAERFFQKHSAYNWLLVSFQSGT